MELIYKLIFIAVMAGIVGWVLPIEDNENIGLNIVVNNTNLAPQFDPTIPGTNARVNGTIYYNNNSDTEIFLYAHANTVAQTSDIKLYINGTMVASTSSKPVGSAEENNKSITAIIPRYASYQAIFSNYHHYEWREYQILSGNVTSSATTNTSYGLARAYLNNSSVTVSPSSTRLILNNVSYNPYSEYNTTTGNFTVQETGYYDILSSVDFSNVTASNRYLAFIQENNTIILLSSVHSSNTNPLSAQMADTQLLHSGDIISLWASGPVGTGLVGSTSANTWMSISLKSKFPP